MSITDITTELPSLAKEAISTWILLPIVWYYMKNFTTIFSDNLRKITENQAEIFKGIKEMNKRILTDNIFLEIIQSKILLFNSELIQFLVERLEKNNIKWRKEEIKNSIIAWISEYKLNHYEIFNDIKSENYWPTYCFLTDELDNNWFIEEIFDVFFDENKTQKEKENDFKTVCKSNVVCTIDSIKKRWKNSYNFII